MNEISPRFFSRIPEQFGGKIPFIVSDIIKRLREMNAINSEGIFRLSGSSKDMSELCNKLDKGRIENWDEFPNVNTVACSLKKYFRDLIPLNPMFPYSIYDQLIEIIHMDNTENQIKRFKEIFYSFSKPRLFTFAHLFEYLAEVEANSSKNKMNAMNLGIIFAPNLICKQSLDQHDAIKDNSLQNKVISTIIKLYHKIFENFQIPETAFLLNEDIVIISTPPIDKNQVDKLIQMRSFRRRSIIPFVPFEFLSDPNFVRPNRIVVFESE